MSDTAEVLEVDGAQIVRLPDGYRITGSRVTISRDPVTGHIVLSPRPPTWADLLALDHTTEVPDDFLGPEDRKYVERDHDPLAALDE